MPVLDLDAIPVREGSGYPEPYATEMGVRTSRRLGDAAGLTQFGVNLVELAPGAKSSLRHWHENEDEFAWILEGELVLIEDDGETVVGPGTAIGWPKGTPNGHQLVNRSDAPARFLVVGTRAGFEIAHYSDVDMVARIAGGKLRFERRDGTLLKRL